MENYHAKAAAPSLGVVLNRGHFDSYESAKEGM